MTMTLATYAQEILPSIRTLEKKKEILKEWANDDPTVLKFKVDIKALQDEMKAFVETTESELVREIKDLTTDIGLACKAAAKGSAYKPAELKGYFTSRAKEKVEDVLEKASLFEALNGELL